VVYDPEIGGQRHTFGVSGLLYKQNALFFDRETQSLWSQLLSQAVAGSMAGTPLRVLPAENTTWEAWRKAHPDTRVLSFDTRYPRDYRLDPYAGYLLPRRPALLVSSGGKTKIYPFSELKKCSVPLVDQVGGDSLKIRFNGRAKSANVEGGIQVNYFEGYLDDLEAFFPDAEIYRQKKK
jgi:hypothetical protein